MLLADANLGQVVTVHHVGGDRAFRRRLMELGLVPGTQVELVAVAPLGDPLELLVRGSSLSIRRTEARLVKVVHVEAQQEAVQSSLHPATLSAASPAASGLPARGLE